MPNQAKLTLLPLLACAAFVTGAQACGGTDGASSAGDAGTVDAAGPKPPATEDASVDAAVDAGEDASDPDAGVSVAGQAFFRYLDSPIDGATVTLGGAQRTTGPDGRFSFTGVKGAYDLTVSSVSNGVTGLDVFRGLTSTAPTLESQLPRLTTPEGAIINGTLTGITSPLPAGHVVRIFARTNYGGIATQTITAGQLLTYAIGPQWFGSATRSVTVRAIAYQVTPGQLPSAFVGFGSTTVNLTSGQPSNNVDIAMTAPATKSLPGTIDPVSYTGSVSVFIRFGTMSEDGAGWDVEAPASTPFSILAPNLPGASTSVSIFRPFATGSGSDTLWDQAASYALVDPPGEPTPIAPAAGATFAPGMTFTWTAPAATGAYRFILRRTSGQGAYFQETTTATSVTLPASFVPTPGVGYTWDVRYFPRATTTDALVGTESTSLFGLTRATRTLVVP